MAPKYASNTYNLGSYYHTWSKPQQEVIDQALNMIDVESPAGKILYGNDTSGQIFLSNAVLHKGTDNAGLAHVNFVIKYLGTGGDQSDECHLYPDGRYTEDRFHHAYPGNPAGKVVPKSTTTKLPTKDEFPPLGGKKSTG